MSDPTEPPVASVPAPSEVHRTSALVIWNASAGQKRPLGGGVSVDQARELLDSRKLRYELVETTSAEEAVSLARSAASEGRELVVAAGGDGTIGVISGELVGSQTALGILPLGSVMNIPRMLGLPRELEPAIDVLATGQVRLVDVGEANGRLFYEAASVGLNATIFSAAERLMERDYLSLRRLLWIALRHRPARMRLEIDDRSIETRALMATISNGPYTGLGMTVAPTARVDDGLFDVRVFRNYSKLELVRHLLSISFGRRAYMPNTNTYRASHVRIEARSRSLPVRVDGVNIGRTPLECHVRRACLRVLVSPDAFEAGQAGQAGQAGRSPDQA
ncbi:MAG TPA: diacylglycerol kinase family protein [Candidatus Limnocylindrales bacterium]|nr:diacylglycerol kinase family protein [Candidatus Limnocylindrales bacterium]